MSQIKIELSLDTNNPKHLLAASQFLANLGGAEPFSNTAVEPKAEKSFANVVNEETSAEKVLKLTKSETAPAPKVENAPDPKVENAPDPKAESEYTLKQVQDKLQAALKADRAHKPKIKEKLTELGAEAVSKMEKAKYGEFIAFLDSLA